MDKLLQAVSDNRIFVIVSLSMVALGCVLFAVHKLLCRVEALEGIVLALGAKVEGKTHTLSYTPLSRVGMGTTTGGRGGLVEHKMTKGDGGGLPSWD